MAILKSSGRCLRGTVSFQGSLTCLPFSLPRSPQEQHRRLGCVRLQPQCHLPGLQRALQVPGELTLCLAAVSQPQPQLPGNFRGAVGHSVW